MIYLASPYSHPDPLVVKTRYLLAMECCANLLNLGKLVWSPIVHSHIMAETHHLPTDAAWWEAWARDFIRRADSLFILAIPGWDESKGVKMEHEFALACQIPVVLVNVQGDRVA